jgi:very-short-patch-repair endonuclease
MTGKPPEPYDSWFEVDVALELLNRSFKIRPQYEVAGKRIDLIVEGTDNRLAVECDGDTWHGPENYEHDMARQRQLERAGFVFIRIRASEFYLGRPEALSETLTTCKELGIRTISGFVEPVEQANVIDEELSIEPAIHPMVIARQRILYEPKQILRRQIEAPDIERDKIFFEGDKQTDTVG